MNLVVDIGNSLIKAGIFEKESLLKREVFNSPSELQNFLKHTTPENLIISSVIQDPESIISSIPVTHQKFILSPALPLPIVNKYATPATLGVDRIAAACGARSMFPQHNCLIIDIGTCINYEFLNESGEYLGGAISPGVTMRFEAMHHFTAKLPLAKALDSAPITGNSTISCLQSGVMNGILEEIKGTIGRYEIEYPGVRVILCGGDAHFFENHLNPSIFVAPELVLVGLNSILLYNVTS
jgi:type III pantothenate kinase